MPHGSAGEYCAGNGVGGEAAARTARLSNLVAALYRGVEQWQLVGLNTAELTIDEPRS